MEQFFKRSFRTSIPSKLKSFTLAGLLELNGSDLLVHSESTTKIPPMRFTDRPAPPNIAYPCETLQIYSVKIAGIRGGLQGPLDVFGIIAMRDCIDHNRNVIFNCTRDNCQTLTETGLGWGCCRSQKR
ncbi:hypothetical protein PVAP13_2NG542200 [Panicum virgatum]|uniref:DUF6598 domain-containing protein n=1 Tax=Panicum virgatum TaxID=38727 RepID=A0A8T0VWL6_PANVG|nr:hypothetical protein PVAP13_2NG542200 [Panicum virgatum]